MSSFSEFMMAVSFYAACLLLLSSYNVKCFNFDNVASQSPAIINMREGSSTVQANVSTYGETVQLNLKKLRVPDIPVAKLSGIKEGVLELQDITNLETGSTIYKDEERELYFNMRNNSIEGLLKPGVTLRTEGNITLATKVRTFPSKCGFVYKKDTQRQKRSIVAQADLYPHQPRVVEITVVVDSLLYKKFDDAQHLTDYLRVYWGLVSRRFMTENGLLVVLRLSQILFSESSEIDSHFVNTIPGLPDPHDVTMKKIKTLFADHRKTGLKPFDVLHVMTARRHLSADGGTVGGAATLFLCNDPTKEEAINVGFSTDNGGYAGMLTTAHELVHNFGVPHDGEHESKTCTTRGYLMDAEQEAMSPKNFILSSCSSQIILKAAESASCLRTLSHSNYIKLNKVLPGTFYSSDSQCDMAWPGTVAADHTKEGMCSNPFYCTNRTTDIVSTYYLGYLLEGTPCDENKFCFAGSCVDHIGPHDI